MSVCAPLRRSFSDERGPGTFHSLGILPKRKSDAKSPVFHIDHDTDDDHSSSLDELSTPTAVPFPRSTSPRSPSPPASGPHLPRGASAPILLSNGKPLKPSLKSSSVPPMLTPPHIHLRARSEPSTPAVTPKNVHFPEKDYALATVRIFNRTARPASLSCSANGNGDETETEGEDTPPTCFPFPRMPPPVNYEIDPAKSTPVPSKISPHANILLESLKLSSSSFSFASTIAQPLLTGSALVRNLAFEKHVAIRFTLDDWQTVSEVSAHYVDSLPFPPSHIVPSSSASTPGDSSPHGGKGWDRFVFAIRLEDYARSLSTRTIWLVARYRVNSTYPEPGSTEYGPHGEWWDNNEGNNYRVGFRPAVVATPSPRSRPRSETVSGIVYLRRPRGEAYFTNTAPIASSRTQPQSPLTCKEHALGHMIPSASSTKETQPVNATTNNRRSVPLRVGKLNLCNYVPPTVHTTTSSISLPSSGPPSGLAPSSVTDPELPASVTSRPPSDEDSTSPASSTLSTPSVSPTISSRAIIGEQPATDADSSSEREDGAIGSSKPGHISDWDWSAPGKPRIERPAYQRADLVPVSDALSRPGKALTDNSLYDAFVTQWCFAQGPSPIHSSYGDGGIMA